MSILGFIKRLWRNHLAGRDRRDLLAMGDAPDIARADWPRSLREPTEFYHHCFRYFHFRLPAELRAHRDYFALEKRGFGEEAFHVMWFLLFQEFQPRSFLEIGVYRGQSLSLAALLLQRAGVTGRVVGISPFSPVGDSVSKYDAGLDYQADTLRNFRQFNLSEPELIKAYSTDRKAVEVIHSAPWDVIYIDGNHDYEVARQDWDNCAASVRVGGIIVLDDAALSTSFNPPAFASKGHPGPSRLAEEIDRLQFAEVLQVGHNRVFQRLS